MANNVIENPDVQRLISQMAELQAENEKLKEFARHVIRAECWDIWDLDGGTVQDWAEELGLIKLGIVTKEETNEFVYYEEGDMIYKYSDILK
jgi:predicted transcriptional regulator with HTH domain